MIRAILFDKDGTLTDFRATWEPWMPGTIHALAAESGADVATVGDAFGFDFRAGRIRADGRFVTATGAETGAEVARAIGWETARLLDWLEPRSSVVVQVAVPGLPRLMARLSDAGLRLGVLTNADRVEAARHLERLGVAPYLSRVIACDDGFGAKPDPRGAADFADAAGLSRDAVLLVGDGLADLAAARGAGLRAVAVLTGTQDADALREAEAVLPDVTHLPGWLTANGLVPSVI